MQLDYIVLQNFRCFGSTPEVIHFDPALTTLVGDNGSGKTAALLALQKMFGIALRGRELIRQDFHVSLAEIANPPRSRSLAIDYIFSFPELAAEDSNEPAVPQFFQHMATDDNGQLKCRLRLEATWTDDGSAEGLIDKKYMAIRTMQATITDEHRVDLRNTDRARIQMIYVPAMRDGASQVTTFLSSRLWRAVRWSQALRDTVKRAGTELNKAFSTEPGVDMVAKAAIQRWQDLYSGGTHTTPRLAPVDIRFSEFISNVGVLFHPDQEGAEQSLGELSDGQRSLFHLSLTAATLDVESSITGEPDGPFELENLFLPCLTIIGIEEPENNLAPFYLSRIVQQVQDLTSKSRAQAVISSHSASILARVTPEQVRHFRMDRATHNACVRSILLPTNIEEASKYVREAVRTYPELYFASFVVLGEGASEEIVLPRLAEALGIAIDRSFVAVVPLGGRHVKHLWKLLHELEIPHATLLDLDIGRSGGGWGRIKTVCEELIANSVKASSLVPGAVSDEEAQEILSKLSDNAMNISLLEEWCARLQNFGVYFCTPLDLDMSMLAAFKEEYQRLEASQKGPSSGADAFAAVLGTERDPSFYSDSWSDLFLWYRYLFLGRGKPNTHVRVLANADDSTLAAGVPAELKALLDHVSNIIFKKSAIPTPYAHELTQVG